MKPIIQAKIAYKKHLKDELVVIGFYADMKFKSGQFFQLILDEKNSEDPEKGFRPYSISTSPKEYAKKGIIETCIKLYPGGLASGYIQKLNTDEAVLLRGPFGRFGLKEKSNNHVFFCSGTGIVPIRSIILENSESGDSLTLFFSAKNIDELAFHEDFKALEKINQNFHYHPTLTREESLDWKGLKGRIQTHLGLIDLKNRTFYLCGLKDFVSDIRKALLDSGVNPDDIVMERYD